MEKIILVHVTGGDRPGLTAELSDILAGYDVDVLDIGQVVIVAITDGRGADIVFDPVAGPFLEKLAQAAAPGATIFEYGALSMAETPYPLFDALGKGLTIRGYTLFEIVKQPASMARGKQFIYDGLAAGALKPVIARTFPLDDIVEAHRYMESNRQVGKIVVTV